jgi:hypothetical protein
MKYHAGPKRWIFNITRLYIKTSHIEYRPKKYAAILWHTKGRSYTGGRG